MEQNVLNTDLTGKVAVVTGASGTLCSIFAKALARAGAKVALLGRNMEKLKALADEIEAEGGIARGYTCNVMNKANCLQVAEDVMAELGPCDILVNGAGGSNARANTDKEYFEMADLEDDTVTFFDLDESGVEMVFDLNFIGTLLPAQAFARQMVGRPGCNILNISSMNAYLPLTKIPAYSSSKAAVTNFTQWLAVHFSKVGIRVNAIAPGFFASEQNASLLYNEDGTPTARTNKILAATPMTTSPVTVTEFRVTSGSTNTAPMSAMATPSASGLTVRSSTANRRRPPRNSTRHASTAATSDGMQAPCGGLFTSAFITLSGVAAVSSVGDHDTAQPNPTASVTLARVTALDHASFRAVRFPMEAPSYPLRSPAFHSTPWACTRTACRHLGKRKII